MAAPGSPGPARAVRLTFAFDEDGIRLIDRTPVDKRIPPSDAVVDDPPPDAFAAELRTAQDDATFRRVLHDAIPQDVEVFDPVEGVSRRPVAPTSGAFTVLVPDDADAAEVVLIVGADAMPEQPGIDALETFRDAPAPGRVPHVIGRFSLRGGDDDGVS